MTAVIGPAIAEPRGETDERQAAEDWVAIERLQGRNGDADPEEVLADATAAVEEVRREMHEERLASRRR